MSVQHLVACEQLFTSIGDIVSPSLNEDVVDVLAQCKAFWPHDGVPQRNKMRCVKLIRALRDRIFNFLKDVDAAVYEKARRCFDRFYIAHLRRVVAANSCYAWRPVYRPSYVAHVVKQQLHYDRKTHADTFCRNISKVMASKFDTLVLFHLDKPTWTQQCLDSTLCPGDIPTLDMFVDTLQKHLEQRWIHVTRDLDIACKPRTMTVVVESQRLTSLWLCQSKDEGLWQQRLKTIRDAGASVLYLQPDAIDPFEPIPKPFSGATKIRMFLTNYHCAINTIERFFF